MYSQIDQARIIYNLNKYLQWHNLPVRMNEGGICNGLASVYTKYVLEDKEEEFFNMLQYISGKQPTSDIEIKLNHFTVEILVSFIPDQFNPNLPAFRSIEALTINNKKLKSTFDFPITTSDKNWAEIIKTIDLKDKEVMKVSGAKHAVSVSKKGGKFKIYDPNYPSGAKEFSTEEELIQELHKNVFHFKKGDLSMLISVIPHPDNPPREFPKLDDLYDKYLTKNSVTATPVTSHGADASYSTLVFAAVVNDGDVIRRLLATGAEDKNHDAALQALFANNISAFKILIENIKDNKIIKKLLTAALQDGKDEIFDELLKHKIYQDAFNKEILPTGAIFNTAVSGNPQFLAKIIKIYKQSLGDIPDIDVKISEKIVQEHAITTAIQGGSVQCVELLINQLQGKDKLTDQQKLLYLDVAVRINNPHVVSYFIESLSSKDSLRDFSTSHFVLDTIERIDFSILQQLKNGGVSFSEKANGIIAKKEHQSIGILLSIDIQIRKFTEFCKEKIFKTEEKNTALLKGREFAKRFQESILDSKGQEQSMKQQNKPTQQDTPSSGYNN